METKIPHTKCVMYQVPDTIAGDVDSKQLDSQA